MVCVPVGSEVAEVVGDSVQLGNAESLQSRLHLAFDDPGSHVAITVSTFVSDPITCYPVKIVQD